MQGKIIYMTNVDRRYAMMEQTRAELFAEGNLPAGCEVVKTKDAAQWDAAWMGRFAGARLVIIRFMGSTIRTAFWDKCLHYLEMRGIPYFMDAAGSAEEEAKNGLAPEVIDRFKKYTFYGGRMNYRHLWLYAASLFDGM